MKIIKIENESGVVSIGKTQRKINLGFVKDLKVGDYVIVHAGFAIQKLDEKEAKDTFDVLREISQL